MNRIFSLATGLLGLVGLASASPVKFLNVLPEKNSEVPEAYYYGQEAADGKIELNATNGFFDRCYEAGGAGKTAPEDAALIKSSYQFLKKGRADQGQARWHLWIAEAGELNISVLMTVPESDAGHKWKIQCGSETQILTANASDGTTPQKQELVFKIEAAGKVQVSLDTPPASTRIHKLHLSGGAIEKAHLLRARWRPAAAHCRYIAPENCPAPKMWVFETIALTKSSSYSPMTTPFGYFGTSFNDQGKVSKGAGFNFSMWATGRDQKAPPLNEMPRLIATGLPEATYSSFGHEGTGLKFRNTIAYPEGADRLIQAIRIESQDGLTTYYSYFYNETKKQWILYGSGQQPEKKKRGSELNSTGSFCEIPGPPNRERSGDQKRIIKRRGWFYGGHGKWYPAQLAKPNKKVVRARAKSVEALKAGNDPKLDSQRSYYGDDGWMLTETGGMEVFLDPLTPEPPANNLSLPTYLAGESAKQLFALPVEFGASKAVDVTDVAATVEYEIIKTGPNSKAVLHYGTIDSITFLTGESQRGSEAQKEIFSKERTWQKHTAERVIKEGVEKFALTDLKPNTTYFYRLFVTHDEGKSWDYKSGSFRTK